MNKMVRDVISRFVCFHNLRKPLPALELLHINKHPHRHLKLASTMGPASSKPLSTDDDSSLEIDELMKQCSLSSPSSPPPRTSFLLPSLLSPNQVAPKPPTRRKANAIKHGTSAQQVPLTVAQTSFVKYMAISAQNLDAEHMKLLAEYIKLVVDALAEGLKTHEGGGIQDDVVVELI